MINPYDLMLGNWVMNPEGVCIEIYHIKRRIRSGSFIVNGRKGDFWNPIPLTPELMETLNWEKRADNAYLITYATKNNYYIGFPQKDDDYRKVADPISGCGDCEVVVHYLHELQNLYRWETGKQLEVNL